MTPSNASEQSPWWADVAHLRDDAPTAPRAAAAAPTAAAAHGRERHHRPRQDARRPSNGSRRGQRSGGSRPDWFAQEALSDGRVAQREAQVRSERPRAQLVDVAPDHAALKRPLQVRRKAGERPTVTITGRPEAALPPRPTEQRELKGRRVRETASSLISSPDRMIMWAVALGVLMILASLGTASADAATFL